MSIIVENLRQFGLNDKEISVYLTLISLGPSPARVIAQKAKVNRGTCYDILKNLIGLGLLSTYDQYHEQDKRQYFAAEAPEKLLDAIENKKRDLESLKVQLSKTLPELQGMYDKTGGGPVMKYYEGDQGMKTVLQDVITSLAPGGRGKEGEGEYYVYSSADIREHLYRGYPNFNEDRLKNKIKVKVIAIGKGGELAGLDERKWLDSKGSAPTYVIIYSGKVAMFSVGHNQAVAAVVEDKGLYETQKIIFQKLWESL